ncbi:MAG: hypothetical protein WCH78_09790 [Bacteroidota bacterium]
MKWISHILHQFILIILAIQLLNMSFNNLNCFYSDETVSTICHPNQIDSIYEYITESLLGWDNFVPEILNNRSHPSSHFHKTANICWYIDKVLPTKPEVISIKTNYCQLIRSSMLAGYIGDINPPPPKGII